MLANLCLLMKRSHSKPNITSYPSARRHSSRIAGLNDEVAAGIVVSVQRRDAFAKPVPVGVAIAI